MSQCNPSLLLTYSLQATQKADLRGEAMNYLFIGLLELSFLRELPSRRYDGGENKRTFEVQKKYKIQVPSNRESSQAWTQFKLSDGNRKRMAILEVLLQIAPPAATPATVDHKSKPNHNILLRILVVTVSSSQKIFKGIITLATFAAQSYFQITKGKGLKKKVKQRILFLAYCYILY